MTKSEGPKVAVITRTKDRAILLERAIKSVHAQSMPDFVHVIINDAGDPKIVNDLVKKHAGIIKGRVKVIHNTESRGMEAASNKAIKSVDSTFIAIHDDDDTWHPDFLKETTERLEQNGMMGVVVTTDRIIEKIHQGYVEQVLVERWLPDTHEVNFYKMCKDNYATPITFLFRRSVFEEIGYYDESLLVCGDWDFGLRFLRKYDIDFLDKEYALAYYHHRPSATGADGNSVFAGDAKHRYFGNLLANKYLRDDLNAGALGLGYIFNVMREVRYMHAEEDARIQRIHDHLQYVQQLVESKEPPLGLEARTVYYVRRQPRRIAKKLYRGVRKVGRKAHVWPR